MSGTQTQLSLAAAAAQSKVQSLLSPVGAIGATVSEILVAANGDISAIENTANAVLSSFASNINDPIQSSFSQGQPYSGTFITAPTVTLVPIALAEQALASSTAAIAQLSCEQLGALAERVGFEILNDTGLAQAMAFLFNEVSTISNLAFSIALDAECLCGCTDVTPYTYPTSDSPTTYTIPSITPNPNITNLTGFVTSISGSFPNTPGIEGIAASVWVDGLNMSVGSNGSQLPGIPQNINSGIYNDITTSATGLIPTSTPLAIVDYSYQQNLLNTVLALSIDNGLITTIQNILNSSYFTPVSTQVILSRLGSVAARGDTALFIALTQALGSNNVPNKLELAAMLISSLSPSDVPSSSKSSIVFYAGGSVINTTTNTKTLAELIADIESILSALGITAEQVFSQNTCNSIFCSSSLLNVPMIKAANQLVVDALLGTINVQMANMFA